MRLILSSEQERIGSWCGDCGSAGLPWSTCPIRSRICAGRRQGNTFDIRFTAGGDREVISRDARRYERDYSARKFIVGTGRQENRSALARGPMDQSDRAFRREGVPEPASLLALLARGKMPGRRNSPGTVEKKIGEW